MRIAYIDTSCMVAIALNETGARAVARRLSRFPTRVASNLLESELRSALARESLPFEPDFVAGISWILPDRPLSAEMELALKAGHLRGADLWHIACALSLNPEPGSLTFLTLDERQRAVAAALGFAV